MEHEPSVVVRTRISPWQYKALMRLCHRNRVALPDMIRACLVDALADEGIYELQFVRRERPPTRERGETGLKALGPTTS